MSDQSEQPLEIRVETRQRIIIRPEQVSMPIPLEEWNALVGRLDLCKVSVRPWAVAYSVAFGVGATAGLSVASLAFSQSPWWVLTAYIVLSALGIVSGCICVIAERALMENQQSQVDHLTSDMNRIRDSFSEPSGDIQCLD